MSDTAYQSKWKSQPRLFAAGAAKDERPTPQAFFDALDREFGFTLDAAASKANAKCERFYSLEDDGLAQPWEGVVWCNPPYSELTSWIEKGAEAARLGATVVMLVPAATDAGWFHRSVLGKAEIRFVKGRITFEGQPNPAPFGSMVVVFRPPHDPERLTEVISSLQAVAHDLPYSDPARHELNAAHASIERARQLLKHDGALRPGGGATSGERCVKDGLGGGLE